MEQLKVGIGADTKGLEKGLKDAEKALSTFGTKGMGTLKKGTANGAAAMTAFSRTVQDAPFGLMAVSNNITNLTEQFGYLKTRTGSAGGALKAMLVDLKGFGGITLAISLATSAMLMFGDKLKGAKGLVDEFNDSLGSVSTKSITEFKILTDTMLDVTATQKEQSEALGILESKYSDFDTSLLRNKGNYDLAKKAIQEYITTLVQQAKAQAALGIIEKKQAKILVLEQKKMLKMRNEYGAATVEQFEKRRTKLLELNNKQLKDNEELRKKREKQINDRFDAVKNMGAKEISVLEQDIKVLFNLANVRDVILFGDKNKPDTKTRKAVSLFDLTGVSPENVEEDIEVLKTTMYDSLATINEGLLGIGIDWAAAYNAKKQLEEQLKIENNLMKLNENLSNIVNQGISQTLAGIGNAIGTALSAGANIADAIGNVLLGALGGILTQVGQMAIAIGIGLEAIQIALKSLNPFVAIAAGIALVALGSYFSSQSQAIGNSMGSGGSSSSSGGGSYSAPNVGSGYSAPSSRGGSSGYSGGGTVVFEIAGQKLVGVLSNTLARNKNLGGTLSIGG